MVTDTSTKVLDFTKISSEHPRLLDNVYSSALLTSE